MKIIAENLCKRYSLHNWVFKNINFELISATTYGISGSNGSGKSTLLSIISGINLPSSGKIQYQLHEKNIDPLQWYKYISIATPYAELIDFLSLNELIDYYLQYKKFVQSIDKNQFLEIVYLEEHRSKLIKYFSSGLKQRLKLALAILTDTPILLLDEPTTNLDDEAIQWYKLLLEKYRSAKLVVIASNDQNDFTNCSDIIKLGAK